MADRDEADCPELGRSLLIAFGARIAVSIAVDEGLSGLPGIFFGKNYLLTGCF